MITAVGEFISWLPGELEYSARKAGYDKKVERAKLPTDDPRSIYGFLGAEWNNHQLLRNQGALYKPFHGMSAQLQLAKFAAGLFDKAALATWIQAGIQPSEAEFVAAAKLTSSQITETLPHQRGELSVYDILENPFDSTPFAEGVALMMKKIVNVVELEGARRWDMAIDLREHAIGLGGLATNCYTVFANENLSERQYVLPKSNLV